MSYSATGTMVAIVHDRYGEADGLRSDIVPIPSPGPHEVRVRVRAVSLNPADKFLMRGNPRMIRLVYGLRKPRVRVRGQDFAGVVDAVGDGVSTLAVGDEVFGEISGTLAEYAVGSADHMAPTPHGLTFEHAAAIPMAGLAALHLLRASGVGNGTRLLINGASGGIGTFAIQIARARGAEVTAVCSTRNLDLMASLGASLAIDYTARNVLDTERRYDVILDNVGNHRIREWLPLLRPGGILLPNTGEPGPDGGAVARLIKASWHHLVSRYRVPMVTSSPNTADLIELAALVEDGTLTVVIDTTFDFAHAPDAMARVATGHARGKVVVTLPGE